MKTPQTLNGLSTTYPVDTEAERIEQAYLRMAREARYRPAAPGDGFGAILLTDDELADPGLLAEESREYARRFIREENTLDFHIGVSNWSTNRALVFTIEAARSLCGVRNEIAIRLLRMAIAEIEGRAR